VLIAVAVIVLGGAVMGAFPVEHTVEFMCLMPEGEATTIGFVKYATPVGDHLRIAEEEADLAACIAAQGMPGQSRSHRVIFRPSWEFVPPTVGFTIWALLIWAFPALFGLYTQIRKGLPGFARAPRTIIVAANYESHRLIYIASCALVWLAALHVRSWLSVAVGSDVAGSCLSTVMVVLLILAVGGWVGPVRSDYTRQLVRSRVHGARIVIMYALVFPPLGAIALWDG
ncbi:MAG: hypothetical protein KJ749_09145, partial [Planctomycetes bacterium]|nr:hypothetical protein [Planctomycetota bacterium]